MIWSQTFSSRFFSPADDQNVWQVVAWISPRRTFVAHIPFTIFFPTNKTRARHCSQSSLLESIRVRFSGSHLTLHEVSSLWNRLNSVWLMGNWLGSSSDTGLDHCPRILLSCFRARTSDCSPFAHYKVHPLTHSRIHSGLCKRVCPHSSVQCHPEPPWALSISADSS